MSMIFKKKDIKTVTKFPRSNRGYIQLIAKEFDEYCQSQFAKNGWSINVSVGKGYTYKGKGL